MAGVKTITKGELTISPDAFNTIVKLKEELEDVIETIEIMNKKQKRLHHRLWLSLGLVILFSRFGLDFSLNLFLPIRDKNNAFNTCLAIII